MPAVPRIGFVLHNGGWGSWRDASGTGDWVRFAHLGRGSGGRMPAVPGIGFVLHNGGVGGRSGEGEKGSRGEEKGRSGEVIGFVLHNGGWGSRRDGGGMEIGFVSQDGARQQRRLGSFRIIMGDSA